MVVMLNEGVDLGLEVTGQEVVLQQDAVLEGLAPALDLALGLGMHWSAPDMAHGLSLDIIGQFAGDVAGAVAPTERMSEGRLERCAQLSLQARTARGGHGRSSFL